MSRGMAGWLARQIPQRTQPTSSYILMMSLATRLLAAVCAELCVWYIISSFRLPQPLERAFTIASSFAIVGAVIITVLLPLWLARDLCRVLAKLRDRQPVDPALAARAGEQAVLYPGRHARYESVLDPLCVVVPIIAYLWIVHAAPVRICIQVLIAGIFGISCVVMMTYFINQRWMAPIVRYLMDNGVPIPFDDLSPSRLHVRMNLCFGATIIATTLMIGALANQRAIEIIERPDEQEKAVADLRQATVVIMIAATAAGLILSRSLARSVTLRVHSLVDAMKRVQEGALDERLRPTGNDELDVLTRQFNRMVEELDQNDQTIRDLNANLERKVRRRTRQLSRSKLKLQRSFERLREYDRLKTQFFSNISHELRTPLTMILTPVERLLATQADDLPPEAVSLLRVVDLNGRRLLKLINQLLDFAKLEAGQTALKRRPVDVANLIRDLVATAEPVAQQRRIALTCRLPADLPVIEADEDKLDAIISNLVSNALKFTPEGGSVHVEATHSADELRISVTDTGIGIAPEDRERIFDRFVQLDGSSSREFSGTGLGLSLVRELVQLHGGEIHVESQPGNGSQFWFTLPLTPEASVEFPETHAPSSPRRFTRFADLTAVSLQESDVAAEVPERPGSETILVVDDTPELRDLLQSILGTRYRVLTAADGSEGLRLARSRLPDLILSDVMMPEMDGYEFCRRMKADPETAQIPFVLLTAKAALPMKIEGLNCGADDYLTKPFDTEELLARTRSLLKLRTLTREVDQRNRELQSALADLQAMQAQLVQSEKMTSLGQLVAGLAHEINNAINAVYNGIQPLHTKAQRLEQLVGSALAAPERLGDPATRRDIEDGFRKIGVLAETIEHGARRTARIVGDLKTFSHPGSEKPDSFDVNQALDVCLTLLSNHMKHRITVHRQYGEFGPMVGPAGQINQVFMNILNNAQQAMGDSGEITISTRLEDERVRISIRDTGSGIPESIRHRIFDPFFTTKPPGVGTGLGLSISYSIIKRLNGSLSCVGEPGQGTEFIISLPMKCEFAPLAGATA